VNFEAQTGTLNLGSPYDFNASINGFGAGDTIDLLNTTATGFVYSGTASSGQLTLTTGFGSDVLNFNGNYSNASFSLASDGHGGTSIAFK
jgi:hypothetical protein